MEDLFPENISRVTNPNVNVSNLRVTVFPDVAGNDEISNFLMGDAHPYFRDKCALRQPTPAEITQFLKRHHLFEEFQTVAVR